MLDIVSLQKETCRLRERWKLIGWKISTNILQPFKDYTKTNTKAHLGRISQCPGIVLVPDSPWWCQSCFVGWWCAVAAWFLWLLSVQMFAAEGTTHYQLWHKSKHYIIHCIYTSQFRNNSMLKYSVDGSEPWKLFSWKFASYKLFCETNFSFLCEVAMLCRYVLQNLFSYSCNPYLLITMHDGY